MEPETILSSVKRIINKDLSRQSDSEKIAFYGLTSKSESFYRDVIAHQLYNQYIENYYVVREWNKCDIAVLDKKDNKPKALIEFKVCYNCDLYKPSTLKEYRKAILNDYNKSLKISNPQTEIITILFIVKPQERIPESLFEVVKYYKAINAGFNKFGNAYTLNIFAEANLRNEFDNIDFYKITTGEAFDIPCELGYSVIQNGC